MEHCNPSFFLWNEKKLHAFCRTVQNWKYDLKLKKKYGKICYHLELQIKDCYSKAYHSFKDYFSTEIISTSKDETDHIFRIKSIKGKPLKISIFVYSKVQKVWIKTTDPCIVLSIKTTAEHKSRVSGSSPTKEKPIVVLHKPYLHTAHQRASWTVTFPSKTRG